MKKKLHVKKPRKEIYSKKNLFKIFIFKIGIRLALVILFCLFIYSLKSGFGHLFFASNPHFLLKHFDVEVVQGIFTAEEIRKKVKFKIGETNLFSLDLGDLRQKILSDALIQEIEVRRLLPDTLSLIVYGRIPIAQLITRGGNLVDSDGIILRANQKGELQKLPIITGVPGIKSYKIGQKLDNQLVLKVILFLKLKEVVTNGTWFDVNLIQLNENYNEIRVYLNENKSHFISDGAKLILPTENIKEALIRAVSILEHRVRAQQPTSFIDATYEKRVPVRP